MTFPSNVHILFRNLKCSLLATKITKKISGQILLVVYPYYLYQEFKCCDYKTNLGKTIGTCLEARCIFFNLIYKKSYFCDFSCASSSIISQCKEEKISNSWQRCTLFCKLNWNINGNLLEMRTFDNIDKCQKLKSFKMCTFIRLRYFSFKTYFCGNPFN